MKRICVNCKQELDISNFNKKGWFYGKQRYRYKCKKCYSEYEKSLAFVEIRKKYRSMPSVRRRLAIREKIRYMILKGKIKKLPCIVCGDNKSEAHHFNYNKPLQIVWLCSNHHRELHFFNPIKV